jgi:hypothetical protein
LAHPDTPHRLDSTKKLCSFSAFAIRILWYPPHQTKQTVSWEHRPEGAALTKQHPGKIGDPKFMLLGRNSSSSVSSLFAAQFSDIEHQALDRLTQDRSLYDTKTQSNFATAPSYVENIVQIMCDLHPNHGEAFIPQNALKIVIGGNQYDAQDLDVGAASYMDNIEPTLVRDRLCYFELPTSQVGNSLTLRFQRQSVRPKV